MRKYGQHFLVNKGIIDKITDAVIDNMEGSLVEIGPGKGAITTALLERGVNNFTLIEIDPEMADYLKNNLPEYAEVEIKNNDFLKEDLSFLPESPVTFVSNLPYIDAAEILLFVRRYGQENGVTFARKNTELLGEFTLHKAAYKAGIRRGESENLDWDYGKDRRPLVNAFSKAIGYAGL